MLSWYLCQAISIAKQEESQVDSPPWVGTDLHFRETIWKNNNKTGFSKNRGGISKNNKNKYGAKSLAVT